MPLLSDSFKIGFGLWRHVGISFPLEIAILPVGAVIYVRAVLSQTRLGETWLWLFVAAIVAGPTYGSFGPKPASPFDESHTAIVAYLGLAALAGLVSGAPNSVDGPGQRRTDAPP